MRGFDLVDILLVSHDSVLELQGHGGCLYISRRQVLIYNEMNLSELVQQKLKSLSPQR